MMQETITLERRMAALEAEVEAIKKKLEPTADSYREDWIERICGSFKGDPEFGEILRLGAEIRRADRSEDIGH